ncbi:MAG: hypothetical protein V7643_5288 [Mycobacterium sp.]
MTYPPGSPGYPPAQQPTTQFAAPTQQFGKAPDAAPAADGPSKLPVYLTAAVAALGLAVYLASYGPLFTITSSDFQGLGDLSGASFGLELAVVASLLAGLLAGVSLLPKQKTYVVVVAVFAVVSLLLVIAEVLDKPSSVSIGWSLYLIIAFSVVQAIIAVAVLLFDAGVINAPAPRPRYEQQQYGQYGGPGPYYGQQHQPGPPHQQQQQRPGYPSQYGGGYQGGPSTGGFSAGPQGGGPPTPPTGFPTYGQPPQSNASNAPTTQVPAQPSSSSQSGPPPS